MVVPYEDGVASAAEVRKRAGNKDFAQVFMLSRTGEAAGRKRYWPIYEAAVEAGLPVGIHAFGYSGWPMTSSGYPSFYIEEMTEHATAAQVMVTSMIMEGIFERLPDLKVVLIECGFGWLPALGWRLDKQWKRLKDEVPHLKMAPSEYIKKHFWVTTQPMEETENPDHLLEVMNWIGMDRIMFSSDYPHWDFDDPFVSLPPTLTDEQRRKSTPATRGRCTGWTERAAADRLVCVMTSSLQSRGCRQSAASGVDLRRAGRPRRGPRFRRAAVGDRGEAPSRTPSPCSARQASRSVPTARCTAATGRWTSSSALTAWPTRARCRRASATRAATSSSRRRAS